MSKSDAETLFSDEQGSVVVRRISPVEGGVIDGDLNRPSVTSQVKLEKNNKNLSVPLIRAVVDKDFPPQSSAGEQTNNFKYHYKDNSSTNETLEENCKSIFDLSHYNRLISAEYERSENQLSYQNNSEFRNLSSTKSTPESFLPVLAEKQRNKRNLKENLNNTTKNIFVHRAGKTDKKGKKTKRLFDYNNREYLEQSRKARRRKQSEVDIEIGIRLSRFVQTPYEGCVDKYRYSKKYQSKAPLERATRTITKSARASSSENSPLGSSSEHINVTRDSPRLLDYHEAEIRSNIRRRPDQKRSLSISPPRTKAIDAYNCSIFNVRSHNSSPAISPSSSVGPSSPLLSRYRTSNFTTILNSPDNCKRIGSSKENTSFPNIHSHLDSQTEPLRVFQNLNSKMEKSRKYDYHSKTQSVPISISSPDSLRKHVLLNTTVPCGSPTFQRAMEGLQTPKKMNKTEKPNVNRPKSPAVCRAPPTIVRMCTSSLGGRRKVLKETSSTGSPKPHRVSFQENLDELYDEDDATIVELHDRLTSLTVKDDVQIMPRKSILKNRRRSIDDLDVGTKKGLAMYLKSKQKQIR